MKFLAFNHPAQIPTPNSWMKPDYAKLPHNCQPCMECLNRFDSIRSKRREHDEDIAAREFTSYCVPPRAETLCVREWERPVGGTLEARVKVAARCERGQNDPIYISYATRSRAPAGLKGIAIVARPKASPSNRYCFVKFPTMHLARPTTTYRVLRT